MEEGGDRGMAKTGVDFEAVRAWGRQFPDVEEGTTYGSPALKVGKNVVACIPVNRAAEPRSLAVRTGFEERAAMVAEAPETYYVPAHYANSPIVLVRMARLGEDELRDLLSAARRFVLDAARRGKKPHL